MKDLLSTEQVEDRLRSTMARRAEDMAVGDGVAWNPAEMVMPLSLRAAAGVRVHPLAAVAAVAAVVVVTVGAVVGVGMANRDETSGSTGTAADGNAAVPGEEDLLEDEVPQTTVPPTAPGPDSGQILGTTLASYARSDTGAVVELRWFPPPAVGWDGRPGSEDLQAGGYSANYWEEPDQHASSLMLFFDDGVLYVDGNEVGMRDDLLAFADGIRRIPGTTDFEVTPPPAYAPR